MKLICLGYCEGEKWSAMFPSERDAKIGECFAAAAVQ